MVEQADTRISELFAAPGRFLRSVQLEKDFLDPAALEGYIVTPPMADALHRMLDCTRDGSKRRAWRITGDYGVGKSSLALVLARYALRPERERRASGRERHRLGQWNRAKHFLPILVTGSREGIPTAVARGVRESLVQQGSTDLINSRIEASIAACETEGTVRALEQLIAYSSSAPLTGALAFCSSSTNSENCWNTRR